VCARGRAQHGANSESAAAVGREWDQRRQVEFTLGETLDYLRTCHRRAPFLFFNGNTFADIARTFADYLFAELPHGRRREATSAIAHYVAGVLDRDSMAAIMESLCETADWKPGDRVKTLRGSTRGVIVRLLDDGRVVWRPDGTKSELMALPESLVREKKGSP
jgi:phosphoglucomutase